MVTLFGGTTVIVINTGDTMADATVDWIFIFEPCFLSFDKELNRAKKTNESIGRKINVQWCDFTF